MLELVLELSRKKIQVLRTFGFEKGMQVAISREPLTCKRMSNRQANRKKWNINS